MGKLGTLRSIGGTDECPLYAFNQNYNASSPAL
jgi:hypothetical protein